MRRPFTANPLFQFVINVFAILYRATDGRIGGRMAGLKVLLLTSIGRKSGKRRTAPLGYFEHEGAYVITATNAGSDKHPAWFLNLRDKPDVQVRVQDRDLPAQAEIVTAELRKQLWAKMVHASPQYARYATRTKREIPMILLHPVKE
jgi:deazaflavin-dependent oxidoreductase (nitroreductase family)